MPIFNESLLDKRDLLVAQVIPLIEIKIEVQTMNSNGLRGIGVRLEKVVLRKAEGAGDRPEACFGGITQAIENTI